jgi:hypothetical protein
MVVASVVDSADLRTFHRSPQFTHSVWVPTRWGASSPTRRTGKVGHQGRGMHWPSGYGAEMGPVVGG